MTSEQILEIFEKESEKIEYAKDSGACLNVLIDKSKNYVINHRDELICALREWLNKRLEFYTMSACQIAKELEIFELYDDIEALYSDIINNKVFSPYYSNIIEPVLKALNAKL